MQEVTRDQKGCIPGRLKRTAITSRRTVYASPLRVVEHIKRFRAKLEGFVVRDGYIPKERHIEVSSTRITKQIATRIAERKTTRRSECCRIEQQRPSDTFHELGRWRCPSIAS